MLIINLIILYAVQHLPTIYNDSKKEISHLKVLISQCIKEQKIKIKILFGFFIVLCSYRASRHTGYHELSVSYGILSFYELAGKGLIDDFLS